MPLNPYINTNLFTQGSENEQQLLAELIEESIKAFGQEFYYLPRTLVAKDEILGEDRLSKFENAYELEMYIETPQGFVGQGEFISKFGLYLEQAIHVTLSRKRWHELVERHGKTILTERPAEGDLVYSPLLKRLFEIKWVEKETNFYQIGSLPVWKMTIELFQYSSERLNTGIAAIDAFETLKTYDEFVRSDDLPGEDLLPDDTNIPGINDNIDIPSSYGDNNKFVAESDTLLNFDESNPFGEV